jgi:putative phage-type endonuclease
MTSTVTASARLLGTWPSGSPEWHNARRGRLGGSEIAAVLGLSPWESRFSLWHRKAGLVGEQEQNVHMSWGHRLEPVIADAFAEEHPEWVVAPAGTYVSAEHDWQLANVDRLVYENDGTIPAAVILNEDGTAPLADATSLLEVKTARNGDEWGEPGTDQIPVYYRCQVIWYLHVLGLRRAHIAVLIAGSDYREYLIDMDQVDPAELALITGTAAEFMGSLPTADSPGVRPDIDGHSSTYQVIREWPDGVVDADVDIDPKSADDYRDALTAFKAAEEEKRRAAGVVLDQIGDARRAVSLGDVVATRVVRPDGTTKCLMPARQKGTAS